MDYAFSLVKLETISVEEFLQMDGDDGWLIGKNLIVCSECRANVFLRRSDASETAPLVTALVTP